MVEWTTKVDQNGRVLVPAAIRRLLGLQTGSELLVTVEDGRVLLVTPTDAWAAVQRLSEGVAPQRSVVESLLDERRAEARREAADGVDDLRGA